MPPACAHPRRSPQVAADACVPSHAGVVYLVETGSLQTKDEHMGPTRVVAILSSSEAADHLRAEEVVWRRQRQDFLQQSNEMSCAESVEEGSVAFREPVMERSDQQKNAAAADTQSFTEVRREWDQAADLNEVCDQPILSSSEQHVRRHAARMSCACYLARRAHAVPMCSSVQLF